MQLPTITNIDASGGAFDVDIESTYLTTAKPGRFTLLIQNVGTASAFLNTQRDIDAGVDSVLEIAPGETNSYGEFLSGAIPKLSLKLGANCTITPFWEAT